MYEKGVFKSLQISVHCELHTNNCHGEFVGHLLAFIRLSIAGFCLFQWNCTWLKDEWPFGRSFFRDLILTLDAVALHVKLDIMIIYTESIQTC